MRVYLRQASEFIYHLKEKEIYFEFDGIYVEQKLWLNINGSLAAFSKLVKNYQSAELRLQQ